MRRLPTRLRETDRAWYSPDFLISLESGGRTAWAVMDSKYSTVGTVLRHHAMQQAFKYLTSLGTVRKDDVYAGLWLYCGSVANDRTQEGVVLQCVGPGRPARARHGSLSASMRSRRPIPLQACLSA